MVVLIGLFYFLHCRSGKTDGLFVFGLVVYTALIMTMQLKVSCKLSCARA